MDPETQVAEQPTADSATEDRIASIFGGGDSEPAEQPQEAASEPGEGAEPEPAAPAEETFDLEIEGEKFTLPKKLEKGFMQERDYTQKSQTLAEQRKSVELHERNAHMAQMAEQFKTDTQQEHQQLQMLDWAISQSVDWASLSTDEAFRRKLQIDGWREQKAQLEKTIEGKREEWGRKQHEAFTQLVRESLQVVAKRIPGWGVDLAKQVTEHALSEGFTETELRKANTDPRLTVALWKAQQYDLLKSKAMPTATTAKTVKTTPTNPMPQKTKDYLNFRKTVQTEKPNSPKFKQALSDRIAAKFGA